MEATVRGSGIVQLEALIKAAASAIQNFQNEWAEANVCGYQYTNELIDKLTQLEGVTIQLRNDGAREDIDELEATLASDVREKVAKVDHCMEKMTLSYAKLARIHGTLRQATEIDRWARTTNVRRKKTKLHNDEKDRNKKSSGLIIKEEDFKGDEYGDVGNDNAAAATSASYDEDHDGGKEKEEGDVLSFNASIIETWVAAVLQMYRRELSLRATILDDITKPYAPNGGRSTTILGLYLSAWSLEPYVDENCIRKIKESLNRALESIKLYI